MNVSDLTTNVELYRLAFQATPIPIMVINPAGRVVSTNPGLDALLGNPAGALVGTAVEQLFATKLTGADPEDRDRFMRGFLSRVADPQVKLFAECHDGIEVPVKATLAPFETKQGQFNVLTLTDQRSAETELIDLRRQKKELETRNLELSRFAYGASHDLKAPIASIMGLLSFCLEDLEDNAYDDLQENLNLAMKLSEEGAGRIDAIFEVSRVGEVLFPIEEIRLETLIRDIWHELTGAEDGRLELLLDLKHQGAIRYERPTLRLILLNVLSNTIRFRDTDKSSLVVKLQSSTSGSTLRINIADNGIGIAADRHRDVFKMFRHIEERSGNGLGLALTKRHVERLDGNISFRSIEGEGSEFSIELPMESSRS